MLIFGAIGYFWPWPGKTPLYSAGVSALGVISVVVVWSMLEKVGTAFFSLELWAKLSPPLRVALLVIVGASILGVALLIGAK